jgi:hypothetical protein
MHKTEAGSCARRLAWFVAFWIAGVACLAIVAAGLRLFMRAAGLSG